MALPLKHLFERSDVCQRLRPLPREHEPAGEAKPRTVHGVVAVDGIDIGWHVTQMPPNAVVNWAHAISFSASATILAPIAPRVGVDMVASL